MQTAIYGNPSASVYKMQDGTYDILRRNPLPIDPEVGIRVPYEDTLTTANQRVAFVIAHRWDAWCKYLETNGVTRSR